MEEELHRLQLAELGRMWYYDNLTTAARSSIFGHYTSSNSR